MLRVAKKKISWGAGQNVKKVAQFIFHVSGGTHGVGHLGFEPFPVAFSQAMPRHSHRPFGHEQHERPKPSAGLVGVSNPVLLQPDEEFLGKVLRVVDGVSLSPDKMIDWIPINPAEMFQRHLCPRGVAAPGGQHDRPVRGHKSRRFRGVVAVVAFAFRY